MKIYILTIVTTFKITQIKSDSVKDSFNILMKDSAIYTVDEFIRSDDYEMMENNNERNENNLNQMLLEINKLAEKEYKKSYTKEINTEGVYQQIKIYDVTSIVQNKTRRYVYKRDTVSLCEELNYDYDELIKDYIEFDNRNEYIKNRVEFNIIKMNDFVCIINDTIRQPLKTILARLWNNMKMWLLVYLAVAIPFWCTKGWSCCCLFCKLFKPQRTIEEAKRYFAANPPGLITLPNVGVIYYEATDREKESYEKFGHVIRTI